MTRRRAPRALIAAVGALRAGALATLLMVTVVSGLSSAPAGPGLPGGGDAGPADSTTYQQVVTRAVSDHHCSITGLAHGRMPSSALVRTPAGRVRHVTFDRGWDSWTGARPGTLVAVCEDVLPPRPVRSTVRRD